MKRGKPKCDSLASAAAQLGVHISVLKRAKNEGCPAFKNTRVDLDLLRPWLEARKSALAEAPMGREALENRKLLAQCAKIEFELEVERKLYILVTDAERETTQLANEAKNILRFKFENELPPQLEGLSAVAIQERCKGAVDEVCERLSK